MLKKAITCFGTTLFLLTSCSIYHPQAVDIPLINHRGDVRFDASGGVSFLIVPDGLSLNFTGSYGFNEWLAGQAHINYGGDNIYTQLSPGVYFPLGKHSVLECYAGMGYGNTWRGNSNPNNRNRGGSNSRYNIDGHYYVPFIQTNFGWHSLTAANIDMGVGFKAGGYLPDINYIEIDKNGVPIEGSEYNYSTSNLLFEPQVMLRFGSQYTKFNIRAGYTWLSDVGHSGKNLTYDFLNCSVGVTLSF